MLPLLKAMWSTWNMLASLGLQWQHMIVRGFYEHCIAAEVVDSRETIPLPRIHLRLSDPNIHFQLCRRRLPIKITFVLTISKAQGQRLKRVRIYLPSLFIFFCLVSWSSSFENVALEVIAGHRQCTENERFVTSLYIEKCFMVSGI